MVDGGAELVRYEAGAARMAVRVAGDREKPALLLIHGIPAVSIAGDRRR